MVAAAGAGSAVEQVWVSPNFLPDKANGSLNAFQPTHLTGGMEMWEDGESVEKLIKTLAVFERLSTNRALLHSAAVEEGPAGGRMEHHRRVRPVVVVDGHRDDALADQQLREPAVAAVGRAVQQAGLARIRAVREEQPRKFERVGGGVVVGGGGGGGGAGMRGHSLRRDTQILVPDWKDAHGRKAQISTSSTLHHLRKFHPRELNAARGLSRFLFVDPAKVSVARVTLSDTQAKRLSLELIVQDELPFKFIESPALGGLLKFALERDLITRKTILSKLGRLGERLLDIIDQYGILHRSGWERKVPVASNPPQLLAKSMDPSNSGLHTVFCT
ncbi:hypothetical protein DFJ73DRAFT_914385 [Zopfochytrium polystomum]|nr:hypothetical protein DFJ73DRAFT_914385 [Zopfochytrium polystomum]